MVLCISCVFNIPEFCIGPSGTVYLLRVGFRLQALIIL